MSTALLAAQVAVLSFVHRAVDSTASTWERRRRDGGQSTAEYALVLLGAATVAIVFMAWAGKSSRIEKLFNTVLDSVIGRVV
ncbi:MAG: DUF4244 domain-containing protein [Acidimicrobiales bacterium]|nr:DUF4244 domain-containing protein [Acidimicrobiales bacterium]